MFPFFFSIPEEPTEADRATGTGIWNQQVVEWFVPAGSVFGEPSGLEKMNNRMDF